MFRTFIQVSPRSCLGDSSHILNVFEIRLKASLKFQWVAQFCFVFRWLLLWVVFLYFLYLFIPGQNVRLFISSLSAACFKTSPECPWPVSWHAGNVLGNSLILFVFILMLVTLKCGRIYFNDNYFPVPRQYLFNTMWITSYILRFSSQDKNCSVFYVNELSFNPTWFLPYVFSTSAWS